MIARYGQHRSTGKWWAETFNPYCHQWGNTANEAKQKVAAYLKKHEDITINKRKWSRGLTP